MENRSAASNENDKAKKDVVFENNTPFTSYTSKINNSFINKTEDLDFVMPMYNLLEYSNNYFMASRIWNYYRDAIADVDDNTWNNK